jgi:hypothetical protein
VFESGRKYLDMRERERERERGEEEETGEWKK